MPRVSESYLAARRGQILEAAWRCFARNGFHATSMQDIFAESGLSAGAVYRYFPSKLDLIKATSEQVAQGVGDAYDLIDRMDPVPPPDRCVEIVLEAIFRTLEVDGTDLGRIVVHVWSEALREPDVGALAASLGLRIRARWASVAVRWKAAGHLPVDADPEDVARFCYGILAGFIVQRQVVGDVTVRTYVDGLGALIRGSAVDGS